MLKLVVYVPETHEEQVRLAMASAGAGKFKNYDNCFFKTKGIGHFRPLKGSHPHIGEIDEIAAVSEYKLETVVHEKNIKDVLMALRESHPYEEIAFDIIEIKNERYEELLKK